MRRRALTKHAALTRMREYVGRAGPVDLVPPTAVKFAESGPSTQASFEQAFSSLGHSYLADKAPKLLRYELGFQILERNQDGTRACGVFAFKVGDQILYAPVFFLNGDLKGHELLYLKNPNLFVPLQDGWVDYLLSKKPSALGSGVERNLSRLGVSQPSLHQMTRSPSKYASVAGREDGRDQDWREDARREMAYFAVTRPGRPLEGVGDLPAIVESAGVKAAGALLSICARMPSLVGVLDRSYPGLLEEAARAPARAADLATKSASALRRWTLGETPSDVLTRVSVEGRRSGVDAFAGYKPYRAPETERRPGTPPRKKTLHDLLSDDRSRPEDDEESAEEGTKKSAARKARVEVVTLQGGPEIRDLSDAERSVLLEQRYLVVDGRRPEDTSRAYSVQSPLKLTNPQTTGLYQVLVRPDEFRRCLVVVQPWSCGGKNSFCTVVDLENKRYTNAHPTKVWCRGEGTQESFERWFSSLPRPEGTGTMVLLTSSGQGTVPLRRLSSSETASPTWDVDFEDHAVDPAPLSSLSGSTRRPWSPGPWPRHRRLRFTGRTGARITRHEDGELWLPDDVRAVVLTSRKDDEDGANDCCTDESVSPPGALELGSLADLQMWLMGQLYPLTVRHQKGAYSLEVSGRQGPVSTKEAAVRDLVEGHGLSAVTAEALLTEAESRGRSACLVKTAAPSMIDEGPSAPYFPEPPQGYDPHLSGGRYPVQEPTTWALPVEDLRTSRNSRDVYDLQHEPDQQALRAISDAVQTGQKEIVDAGILAGLLHSVRDDSIIDRHLPDLMKGMNALGRLLFSLYWHQDQFADRYGKNDLNDLEDGLRNSFESIGEIALELKSKRMDSSMENRVDGDGLEDVANV